MVQGSLLKHAQSWGVMATGRALLKSVIVIIIIIITGE